MVKPLIIPYHPAWRAEFQAIAAKQRQALGRANQRYALLLRDFLRAHPATTAA